MRNLVLLCSLTLLLVGIGFDMVAEHYYQQVGPLYMGIQLSDEKEGILDVGDFYQRFSDILRVCSATGCFGCFIHWFWDSDIFNHTVKRS